MIERVSRRRTVPMPQAVQMRAVRWQMCSGLSHKDRLRPSSRAYARQPTGKTGNNFSHLPQMENMMRAN